METWVESTEPRLRTSQTQSHCKALREKPSSGIQGALAVDQKRGLPQWKNPEGLFPNGLPSVSGDEEPYRRVQEVHGDPETKEFFEFENAGIDGFSLDKVTLSQKFDYRFDKLMRTHLSGPTITISITDKWLYIARHLEKGFLPPIPDVDPRPYYQKDVFDFLKGVPTNDELFSSGPSLLNNGVPPQEINRTTASTYFVTLMNDRPPLFQAFFHDQIRELEVLMVEAGIRGHGTTVLYDRQPDDANRENHEMASLTVEFSVKTQHLRILVFDGIPWPGAITVFDGNVKELHP